MLHNKRYLFLMFVKTKTEAQDTWLVVSKYQDRPFYKTLQTATETDQTHLAGTKSKYFQ